MKKYIAPTSKFINLASEGSLLTESNPAQTLNLGNGSVDGANIDSNQRTSIWGDED